MKRLDLNTLAIASCDEQGKHFETGTPVTFRFVRNTASSPHFGALYGQDVEPAGRYLLHQEDVAPLPPGWEAGEITLRHPLVIVFNTVPGEIYGPGDWKRRLYNATGRKGAALSWYLELLGYDGIVTCRDGATSEIVQLTAPKVAAKRGAGAEDVAQFAYHATTPDRLSGIQQHGLLPAYPRFNDNYSEYDDGKHIFFADSEEYASLFGPIVLRFRWPQDAKPDANVYGRTLAHQFVSKFAVPAADLTIVRNEKRVASAKETPRKKREPELIWYHGGPRITDWNELHWDRDRTTSDGNAEGAGMYWTTDFNEAAGYSRGEDAVIYEGRLRSDFRRMPNVRPTLAKLLELYKLAEEEDQVTFISNWGETDDPRNMPAVKKALGHYTAQDSLFDACVTLYHDLFRYGAERYVSAMRSLGYDGYILEKGGDGSSNKRKHLVLWNVRALERSESDGPPEDEDDGYAREAREDVIKLDYEPIEKAALKLANHFKRLLWSIDQTDPLSSMLKMAENKRVVDGKTLVVGDPTFERGQYSIFEGTGLLPLTTVKGQRVDRIGVICVVRYSPAHEASLFDGYTMGVKDDQAEITVRINVAHPLAFGIVEGPDAYAPQLSSILLHELTHIRDAVRHKNIVDHQQDYAGYLNSPHELKAFMGQVVYDAVRNAQLPGVRKKAELSRTPNETLVDESLKLSKWWRTVDRDMTTDNKAKVLRAVYRALSERGLLYETRGASIRLPKTGRAAE